MKKLILCIVSTGILACGSPSADGGKDLPKRGGTLVYAKNSPPVTMDPALTTDTESTTPCDNVYDPLVQLRLGSAGLTPGLAKTWEISSDGLIYTFHLRTGVMFHDGTPFNADAVLFAMERQRDINHPHPHQNDAFAFWQNFSMDRLIRQIRAMNDSTVEFELQNPNATFLYLLSMQFTSIPSPTAVKRWGKEFGRHPVGTGPFVFTRWTSDDVLVLAANEKYWDGRPFLDTLVFTAVPNADDRINRFLAGAYDMIESPPEHRISELEANGSIKLLRQPGVNVAYLAMNLNKRPYNDERVRRAVVYAINREALVENVYGQLGSPAKNPIPPTMIGYNEEIQPLPYDPSKARELLKEAGFPNGFKTSLWTMNIAREYLPDPKKAAELIRADLHEVGISADVKIYDWHDYIERTNEGEHDLAIRGWIADIPDPDNFFYPLLDKAVADQIPSNNIAFYRGEEMHELLMKGKTETNLFQRDLIYKEACSVFNRDLPWFLIAHSVVVIPMKESVMDFQPYASYSRRFNTVWFSK